MKAWRVSIRIQVLVRNGDRMGRAHRIAIVAPLRHCGALRRSRCRRAPLPNRKSYQRSCAQWCSVLGLVVIDKLLETNWKRPVSSQRVVDRGLARRTEKLGFSQVQRNNGSDAFYLRGTEGDQPSFSCRQAPSARGAAGKEADKCYGVQAITVRRDLHKQWVSE